MKKVRAVALASLLVISSLFTLPASVFAGVINSPGYICTECQCTEVCPCAEPCPPASGQSAAEPAVSDTDNVSTEVELVSAFVGLLTNLAGLL